VEQYREAVPKHSQHLYAMHNGIWSDHPVGKALVASGLVVGAGLSSRLRKKSRSGDFVELGSVSALRILRDFACA